MKNNRVLLLVPWYDSKTDREIYGNQLSAMVSKLKLFPNIIYIKFFSYFLSKNNCSQNNSLHRKLSSRDRTRYWSMYTNFLVHHPSLQNHHGPLNPPDHSRSTRTIPGSVTLLWVYSDLSWPLLKYPSYYDPSFLTQPKELTASQTTHDGLRPLQDHQHHSNLSSHSIPIPASPGHHPSLKIHPGPVKASQIIP